MEGRERWTRLHLHYARSIIFGRNLVEAISEYQRMFTENIYHNLSVILGFQSQLPQKMNLLTELAHDLRDCIPRRIVDSLHSMGRIKANVRHVPE